MVLTVDDCQLRLVRMGRNMGIPNASSYCAAAKSALAGSAHLTVGAFLAVMCFVPTQAQTVADKPASLPHPMVDDNLPNATASGNPT